MKKSKRILGGFCVMASVVYIECFFAEPEMRPLFAVLTCVFGLFAFLLLRRKKEKQVKTPPEPPRKMPPERHVRYSTNTAKKYAAISDEEAFFAALDAALLAAHKSPSYSVTRMANGAISVQSRRAYLGKIKLQGRKTWMQYMTSLYDAEVAEDEPLEEYIRLLQYWVKIA